MNVSPETREALKRLMRELLQELQQEQKSAGAEAAKEQKQVEKVELEEISEEEWNEILSRLVKPKKQEPKKEPCPNCDEEIPVGVEKCPSCGVRLEWLP